jgi:predicted transcriptional regulator
MSTTDHAGRLSAEVEALLQPLHQHYEELTREIDEAETKARDLRAVRTKVRAMIRLGDPDFAKRAYAGNGKPKAKAGDGPVTPETIDRLGDWLVANAEELNALNDGEGFYASGLARDRDDLPGGVNRQQSRISWSLKKLHERGVVRIASKGKGSGGRLYYKVIA